LPSNLGELEKFYTLTPADRDFIAGHRTESNRIGVAVQLCFLRCPGRAWTPEESLPATMLRWIAEQVSADPSSLQDYAERDQTRREHFIELLNEYGWRSFGLSWLMNQARSTDQGMALVVLLIGELRHRRIIVPVLPVLERLTIAARARARREAYRVLSSDLTSQQKERLEGLLEA
jgi:Domain of unknown function (DUF4158)